ncbi:helix-turn-helix domain-containing protein [Rhodococcus sp. NPDC003318]|uniref:helix-turn-helix domain-containing protein n=1 Tax=Rhodococcus sp. NPDC003318 TaxID=3364503 RepID=UPI0036CAC3F2
MTVVFDTAQFASKERADATCTAMQENSAPSHVVLEDPTSVSSLMEVWSYGATSVFRSRMSGMQLLRTHRQTTRAPSPLVAIAVQETAIARYEQRGVQRLVAPGELMVVDLNSEYDYAWSTFGSSRCLHVPIDRLAVPYDAIRAASTRPLDSPVATLVANHISALTVDGDRLSGGPDAHALGEASIDLARALFASLSDGDGMRRTSADSLMARIRTHVRQHLTDPTLSPESIAATHGISTRRLYELCAAADVRLEQWIIDERLHRARDQLARPRSRQIAIATVARRCGFTSHAHFSRRFRALFGVTPREWREISALTGDP